MSVNLHPVLKLLQDLADEVLHDDIAQRDIIKGRFLLHLADAEQILDDETNYLPRYNAHTYANQNFMHDGSGSIGRATRVIAAKKRLEDACLAELAAVSGGRYAQRMVQTIRRICEYDVLKDSEEMRLQEANESTGLLSSSDDKPINLYKTVSTYVPIIRWARNYSFRHDLVGDLFSGCTVAFMTFPQTMGYAILAGLPPIYGLYSSFIPVFIYSIFGTSAEMSVGPAAMVALMIPVTLAPLAPVGSSLYILYATFLSFFSGIILFIAGLVNGGFIVENILSVPLLTGWIQGAAVLIILSQASGFLQIHIPSTSTSLVTVLESMSKTIHNTNVWSVLVGGVCLILLVGVRKLGERVYFIKKIPISLLVLAGVTLLTKLLGWDTNLKLNIIGEIPQGLPTPEFFKINWELIQSSFKAAMAIAIIGFMEGISLAKKFAGKRKYRIDVSQELRALGLANIVGSCFGAFPVTGSVTRTTVNYQSGSRTTFSSIVNGLLVGAVLLFLSPLFYYTPKAALAAIVISAGTSLIDIKEAMFLWKINARFDLGLMLAIFIITLFTGPEMGAMIAILFSVLQIIYRATRPVCESLGPVTGTSVYKPGGQFSKVMLSKGVIVVRLSSGLFFYTIAWLKESMCKWECESPVPVKAIILDASAITTADSSGIHGLIQMLDEYKQKNICIFFSNVCNPLMETMNLAGLTEKAGTDSFFGTTHEAAQVAQSLSFSERLKITVTLN